MKHYLLLTFLSLIAPLLWSQNDQSYVIPTNDNSIFVLVQADYMFSNENVCPVDLNSIYYFEYSTPGSLFYGYEELLKQLEEAPATYIVQPSFWIGAGFLNVDLNGFGGNIEVLLGRNAYSTSQRASYDGETALFDYDCSEWRWKLRLAPSLKIERFVLGGGLGFTGGFAKQTRIGLSIPTSGYASLRPANLEFHSADFSFLYNAGLTYLLSDKLSLGIRYDSFRITTQKEDISNNTSAIGIKGPANTFYHRFRIHSFGLQLRYNF